MKFTFLFLAAVSFGVGTSCSQLPSPAVSKAESVSASADSKTADTVQKDASTAASDKRNQASEQPMPQPSPTTQPTSQPSPQPTPVSADCSDATALKSDTLNIIVVKNIPSAGGKKCPFGMADNVAKSGGIYTARLEFNHSVVIPADRKVCGVNPSAATQSIKYDDHIFVNLNNFVLLASRGIPNEFELDASGYRKYDWAKIVNTDRGSSANCGTGVTCQIPASDSTGNFSFSLSEDARKKLFTAIADKPMQISVVVTGDNDEDSDCRLQNDLTLTFNYSYVSK